MAEFGATPEQLTELLDPKNVVALQKLGGPAGLEKSLKTDLRAGLSVDGGHDERSRVFKDNRLPQRKTKNIFQLMWMAYNDKVLILLTIAAVISLALGIYQSIETAKSANGEAPVEWVEGVAIMVAIIIVVVVGAANDWQKEQQFVKLNQKKDDRQIKVIRSGTTQELSVFDVLVGDIVLLEPGDMVPVDGVFLEGHNVKCDESSATGESELLKKVSAADVVRAMENGESVKKLDPFILSGAKVTEGVGKFVVTAVGVNSTHGKTMMSLREEGEVTPLQSKLNVLAENIAKCGGAAALLYFVVAFIEFIVSITRGSHAGDSPAAKGQAFLQIFILAVSIIVVAVPEGLPLAVTLALAFATTRMLKDNNLVRLLRSCETMGNATTVCSDKTGTLTQNHMTVVAGTLGTSSSFGGRKDSQSDAASTPQQFVTTLSDEIKRSLLDCFVLNSTAFEGEQDGKPAFIGSKTETALLKFAKDHLAMQSVQIERSNANIVEVWPFDSSVKCMGVLVKKSDGRHRFFVKGASEIMLNRCKYIMAASPNDSPEPLSDEDTKQITNTISSYAKASLRTIGLIYKDLDSWQPSQSADEDKNGLADLLVDMVYVGVVGIQDPLRPGVPEAVADCKRAGVQVRMVTGDNVETARAIATECGIYTEDGTVMEGPDFRKLSDREMDKILPNLQVLARSSPEDKRILVKRLKANGETVAVTGDGTNDAPALKLADVGFSMGISGTEVAKEASAIILMDDNFSSIVKALMWGRAVNDAVKKFLQFQITVNITAVTITFISGVSSTEGAAVLTAVQLLWVNLIMDTFAALALATDPPAPSVLDRKPDRKSAPLITLIMWKMIIGQAVYQLVVILVLYFRGQSILGYETEQERDELKTLLFNIFVWMQIANAFNNRRLDNRFNIFEGIFRNRYFMGIIGIMIGIQVLIIFKGGAAISVVPLNAAQWAYSLVLGFLTLPIGMAIRLVPDGLIRACIPQWLSRKRGNPKVMIEDEEQRYEWNPALQEVYNELHWLKKYKGGRLNNLRYKLAHPISSGLLPRPRRPSSARSLSSTITSDTAISPTHGAVEELAMESEPPSPTRERNRLTLDVKNLSPKHRSRSGSNLAPAMAAVGIMAGSIAGWSPGERPPDYAERPQSGGGGLNGDGR